MMRFLLIALLTLCLTVLPMAAAQIPRPAPALTFSLTNGKTINLADYRGKVVCVEFLLTTCGHCQEASASIQRVYDQYKAKGFQPLAIAINEGGQQLVPAFVGNLKLTFPVGYGHHNVAMNFLQHSVVMTMMMPQLVVIDKKGQIRAQYGGTDEFFRNTQGNLTKLVEKLIAE